MGNHKLLVSLLLFLILAQKSTIAQPPKPLPSFKCRTSNTTCQALAGYVSPNTTTLAHIRSLFQVKDLNNLFGVNLLPPSTPENFTIYANQTVKIPFPCRCGNGVGISDKTPQYTVVKLDNLSHIAYDVFSGLLDYNSIFELNKLRDMNMIFVGQKLWIPLACSCDEVEGQKVVHYAHVIAPGSTLNQVAVEFGTSTETLISLNNITDPDKLYLGQVVDVPLKGQVLQNLATPFAADGAVMKILASTLRNTIGWTGSDFCIWPGILCNSNGFVTSISLPAQNISGTLPSDLNLLSNLTTIFLQNNHLSGPLPSFSNLKLLQEIHLDSNKFTSIPDGAFSGLGNLRILSLENNAHLSPWTFPTELADSTILVTFYASNTNLRGSIPDIFASLKSLKNLRLSDNNLTRSLPASLRDTQMEILCLDNQKMGLSGPIDVLVEMNLLKQVWLQGNNFAGAIPNLSNSTSLFDLQLQNNLLTGVVPQSVISLPGLVNISLQNNKLQGPYPIFPESVMVTLGTTNLFCKDVQGDCDPQVMIMLEFAGALGYPLKLAEAWQGNDACKNWSFVTCDLSRNINKINISKQGFSGTISPALANLTSLSELYMNDNNLTGTIPVSLTTLQGLKEINLSNNDLRGEVPNFKPSVTVLTAGNKNIGLDTVKKSLMKIVKVVLAVLVPTISVIAILMLTYAYKKRTHYAEHKDAEQWRSFLQQTPDSPIRFTYHALKTATNNFDVHKKLGGGGFGTVFEGKLNNGTRIAVKRLDNLGQGKKEFLAEVWTIGSIHHVNLVRLVGFCAEKVHRLIVYEHMNNGSLDKWIFKADSSNSLPWITKRKVILHIAKGLAYLHEECQKRIIHLDVKPQNVLLDDEFNAKISDFGLAKLIDRDQNYVMTQMRGTRGYLAPEWLGRKITEKVDVYSFGVVVLEVIFDRKNLDCSHPEESTLIMQVKKKAEESQLLDLIDKISEDMHRNSEDVEKIATLAIWCLQTEPARRPSMSMVVKVLEGAVSLEDIRDYCSAIQTSSENPALETITEISDSILSGPR